MSKPALVLYHADCDDGFTAAWIARKFLPPDTEFMAVRYQEPFPVDAAGRDVYILDFSYPLETMKKLLAECRRLVVLDHHKTAKAALEEAVCYGETHVEFDVDRSGAMMTWDFFQKGTPPPTFVRYIQDRDLWENAMPDAPAVTAYIKSHTRTWENWDSLALELRHDSGLGMMRAVAIGGGILRARDRLVEEAVGRAFEMEIAGHRVLCCPSPILQSEIAGRLAEDRIFGAVFYTKDDRTAEFSLRSKGAFDVSAIAKKFGGGGHRNAAGFTVSIAQLVLQEKTI